MPSRLLRTSLAAALLALVSAPAGADEGDARPALALMGTIPVYWGESDGFGDLLSGKAEAHWARAALEKDFALAPLSYLDSASLAPFRSLLLAQPRALSGEENVALDAWVRAGGHLLVFADPMMTGHSRYAIGDRRRPQDVIMLSPILNHWGLRLELPDLEGEGLSLVDALGVALPVDIPGRFALGEGEGAQCTLSATAVLARCRIGEGTATVVADAAVLDLHSSDASTRALAGLSGLAFGRIGEKAGSAAQGDSAEEGQANAAHDGHGDAHP